MRRPPALVLALLAAAAILPGCAAPNYMTPERYERGLVIALDGAGGITAAPQQICQGLDEGGVKQALEVFKWSAGHDVLEDQQNVERNRQVAGDLAARIVRYAGEHPGRPIHLIGISAGTGIVVFAIEQLPPDCPVDGACLLASSINANYDLTRALTRVRNEITNFSSVADMVVLGLGVTLAGTVDRGQGVSAGIGGFTLAKDASDATRQLYKDKLVEMPWNPTYVVLGHLGDHLGAANPAFVKHFMAPIVLDAERRRAAHGGVEAGPVGK
jgi:hypothetical protein